MKKCHLCETEVGYSWVYWADLWWCTDCYIKEVYERRQFSEEVERMWDTKAAIDLATRLAKASKRRVKNPPEHPDGDRGRGDFGIICGGKQPGTPLLP